MLNVTCDAFIHTLDECVRLANGNSISRSSLIPLSLLQDQPMLPRSDPDPPTESSTSAEKEVLYSTYFSQLTSRFSQFQSMPFDHIPSELFLSTAEEHFSLFGQFFLKMHKDRSRRFRKISKSDFHSTTRPSQREHLG